LRSGRLTPIINNFSGVGLGASSEDVHVDKKMQLQLYGGGRGTPTRALWLHLTLLFVVK